MEETLSNGSVWGMPLVDYHDTDKDVCFYYTVENKYIDGSSSKYESSLFGNITLAFVSLSGFLATEKDAWTASLSKISIIGKDKNTGELLHDN